MSECVHSSTNTILNSNNNADIRTIQHTYDRLWHESRAEIARGNVHTDPIPGHRSGSTRWGVSLLLRPAPPVAERMEAVIARFRPLIGEQHIFYSAANLHTTIRVSAPMISVAQPRQRSISSITSAPQMQSHRSPWQQSSLQATIEPEELLGNDQFNIGIYRFTAGPAELSLNVIYLYR